MRDLRFSSAVMTIYKVVHERFNVFECCYVFWTDG